MITISLQIITSLLRSLNELSQLIQEDVRTRWPSHQLLAFFGQLSIYGFLLSVSVMSLSRNLPHVWFLTASIISQAKPVPDALRLFSGHADLDCHDRARNPQHSKQKTSTEIHIVYSHTDHILIQIYILPGFEEQIYLLKTAALQQAQLAVHIRDLIESCFLGCNGVDIRHPYCGHYP